MEEIKCPKCGKSVVRQDNYLDKDFYVTAAIPIKDIDRINQTLIIANTFDQVLTKYVDKVVKYTCEDGHMFFMEDK